MAFISFEEARQFVRSLGLKSQKGWRAYCKSGRKPFEIPANPARTYKDKWKGFGDWLGTGTIASFNKEFRTFMSSRDFVRRLGLKSSMEWRRYVRSGQKPDDIPSNPNSYYKKDWQGWGDFLGNEFVAFQDRNYSKFVQAKKFVHQLGVKNRNGWQQYVKSGKKPHDIPSDPSKKYQQWMGWGDWLGTGTVAPKNMEFLPFAVARKKFN